MGYFLPSCKMNHSKELRELLIKNNIPLHITGTCGIQSLKKDHLSFFAKKQYLSFIRPNNGAVLLVCHDLLPYVESIPGNIYICTHGDPVDLFKEIHYLFYKYKSFLTPASIPPSTPVNYKVHSTVVLGDNVVLGENVTIYPHVVIGSNVKIGDNTIIYPSVTIYDNVQIGSGCIIDAGAVIGSEGYGWVREKPTKRFIHIGGVIIGDDVEIGANCAIDRGTFSNTLIGARVKIDNLVHIAHNVTINADTRLCVGSSIGGSTIIGNCVWVGMGCTIRDNIEIGENCQILLNAIVASSLPKASIVSGFYAMSNDSWLAKQKDDYKKYELHK